MDQFAQNIRFAFRTLGANQMFAAFAILTFVPAKFVHPLRVKRLRLLSIGLMALWALLAAAALAYDLSPPLAMTVALVAIALYFLGAGLAARTA